MHPISTIRAAPSDQRIPLGCEGADAEVEENLAAVVRVAAVAEEPGRDRGARVGALGCELLLVRKVLEQQAEGQPLHTLPAEQ